MVLADDFVCRLFDSINASLILYWRDESNIELDSNEKSDPSLFLMPRARSWMIVLPEIYRFEDSLTKDDCQIH